MSAWEVINIIVMLAQMNHTLEVISADDARRTGNFMVPNSAVSDTTATAIETSVAPDEFIPLLIKMGKYTEPDFADCASAHIGN